MKLLSVDFDVILKLLELRIDRGAEVRRGVGLRTIHGPDLLLRVTLAQIVAL